MGVGVHIVLHHNHYSTAASKSYIFSFADTIARLNNVSQINWKTLEFLKAITPQSCMEFHKSICANNVSKMSRDQLGVIASQVHPAQENNTNLPQTVP